MYLITSAAYIENDLMTEFGKIPPCFLPVQNKRLYEHQINLIGNKEIILSIPENYKVPKVDVNALNNKGITVIPVPENISIGESIYFVLDKMNLKKNELNILHGDTLFSNLNTIGDCYYVSKTNDYYNWQKSHDFTDESFVYSGFFSISNAEKFKKHLIDSSYCFEKAILSYKNETKSKDVVNLDWFDFGNSNTYYNSRKSLTTERYFNFLNIKEYSLVKSGLNEDKIFAEYSWYKNLPKNLKPFAPALWGGASKKNNFSYEIEYLYLSNLSELFVYGENNINTWSNIFDSCSKFIIECKKNPVPERELKEIRSNSVKLFTDKTESRLIKYKKSCDLNLDHKWKLNDTSLPSINTILKEINLFISTPNDSELTFIHGDFCFSNILYNFRAKSIKVIDPRGIDYNGNLSLYGDLRYDWVTFTHSLIGLYDHIIAGSYKYYENSKYDIIFHIETSDNVIQIQNLFNRSQISAQLHINEKNMYAMLIHLFLSMLPLHKDNQSRQKAMLANALRLYIIFKKL